MNAHALEMCKVLIEGGAMVDAVGAQGRSALLRMCERVGKAHICGKDTCVRFVEYLASEGASFEFMDTAGDGVEECLGNSLRQSCCPFGRGPWWQKCGR
ncbi:unnamed protein product [Ectocarpus sp. 12 AP-2014]